MVQSSAGVGTAVKMQVFLFTVVLQAAGLIYCQTWSNTHGGIVVKTLYLPLRKGSSSISLQDLGSARHLTTLNIPFHALRQTTDVQQSSSLTQNYQHKAKQDFAAQPYQDVRPKVGSYPKLEAVQQQVTNYQPQYYASSYQQQPYGNNPQPNAYPTSQNQPYQPQYQLTQQLQQPVQHNSHPGNQHSSESGQSLVQSAPSTHAESQSQYVNNNLSEQTYSTRSVVPQKKPVYSAQSYSVPIQQPTYTQSYSERSPQLRQYGSVSSSQNVVVVPQKPAATFAGESSRFVHQMQDPQTTYPTVQTSSYVQRPLPPVSSAQQYSYVQDSSASQQSEQAYSNNQNQSPQVYDQRQLVTSTSQQVQHQQPMTNTYAIVHQKIPISNYISQDGSASYRQADPALGTTVKQASGASSHASLVDSRPVEYLKISTVHDASNQMTPENHLVSDNYQTFPESAQQSPKKDLPDTSTSSRTYPLAAKIHLVMPQYSSTQDSQLPSSQYVSQSQSPSSYQPLQTYDSRGTSAHLQSSAQTGYPDPSSETYFPEDGQVYIAPPQGYSSQAQSPPQQQQQRLQQQGSEQQQHSASKYSGYGDGNVRYGQVPVSVQSEQLGIHIAIPTNSY